MPSPSSPSGLVAARNRRRLDPVDLAAAVFLLAFTVVLVAFSPNLPLAVGVAAAGTVVGFSALRLLPGAWVLLVVAAWLGGLLVLEGLLRAGDYLPWFAAVPFGAQLAKLRPPRPAQPTDGP